MNQKNFYTAFNIIYSYLKEPLGIYQKEQFYRMIFLDIYALTGDGLYDNDSIRKITSGQTLIHRRVAKKLYTENGYEIFRESIEKVCLSGEFEKTKMLSDLQRLLKESTVIPDNIKQQINKSFAETSSYQQSRAIAAILICSDKADCAWQKKRVFSLDVSFMRLEADYPPAKYPKYISDSPDAAVEELIGREEELKELLRLYYVCFEASSYLLCKTLIEKVIEIDKTIQNPEMLIRDYRNYGELWLRMDETEKAIQYLNTARRYMKQIDPDQRLKREWAYLWHEYGNIYFHKGEATKAIRYYKRALKIDQSIPNLPRRELSTDYSSIAVIYQAMGELTKAYKMLTKAIEIDEKDENDSEFIMNLYYMATLCTDFVANGYDKYIPKAEQCYKTVIRFREKNLAKNSNDLADVYLEYSNFLYQIGEKTQSSYFANEAHTIYFGLYGEESYHVLQCLNNKALILWEEGKMEEALKMYRDIVKRAANMRNIPFDDVCMDYQNYADLLEHTNQYEEAMEYYKKYIRLIKQNVSENSPKLAQSYIGMANCHMGMGDYETAVKYLEKLAPFTKDDSLLERLMHHKIGTCAAFIGKDDMAADHLEKALQLCDENGILDRGYIYVDLCIIYYRMKQNDKAIFCGKEAKKFAANFKDTAFDEYVHNFRRKTEHLISQPN